MNRAEIHAALGQARGLVATLERALQADAPPPPPAAPNPPAPPPAAPTSPIAFSPAPGGLADPAAFYAVLRKSDVLGPDLAQGEVDGTNAILTACAGVLPLSWAAYALATAYHETAHTMQPVKEANWLSAASAEAYFRRMYDIQGARPDKARELGNLSPGDGARYCGRGYVQLTGKRNYAKATAELRARGLDVDLVGCPDDAMKPSIAAAIMVRGMIEGWFTTKTLNHYLRNPAARAQFVQARRIINGLDKAELIAGHAEVFQKALQAGGWQ